MGPAGLAAAQRADEAGIKNVLLIERDSYLGGILPQCIHSGFGLKVFNRELTGPEYNQIFVDKIEKTAVKVLLNTMALDIRRTEDQKGSEGFEIITANRKNGFQRVSARSIILALGCRERTRGQIMLPGSRPAGIFTAGLVQRMVNIEGYLPGKEIVILGSGDIGLIMARRLTLEGCNVKGVYEIMPFSTGLLRNISQCLDDFGIPLYLSHTVTNISGNKRIESVEVSKVDAGSDPLGTGSRKIKCDTLLLSVGLIPENELSKTAGVEIDPNTGGPVVDEKMQTNVDGIFSCGNSLLVYDLVDNVTEDGYLAAESVYNYIKGSIPKNTDEYIRLECGENVSSVAPHIIRSPGKISLKIRAKYPVKNAYIIIEEIKLEKKVKHVNPGEMLFLDIFLGQEYFSSSKKTGLNKVIVNIKKSGK